MTDAPDEVKLTRRLGEDRLVALMPGETMSMGFLGPVHKYVRADLHAAAVARAEKAEARVAKLEAALSGIVEACAQAAESHLLDWSDELFATRDSLIDAQSSGVWNGRRIRDLTWLKSEARKFAERAEAVAESAGHTAAAIRAAFKPQP